MKQCPDCKKSFDDGVNVCPDCGKKLVQVKEKKKKFVHFKDYFSAIFKRHKKEEKQELFVCGGKLTTPELKDIDLNIHPWVCSRVFLMSLLVAALLGACVIGLNNAKSFPGFIVFASFAVPLTCVIFFFEINVPRNISFAKVMKYVLLGGVVSLFITLLFYKFAGLKQIDYFTAFLIGLIEEAGKFIIVSIIIFRINAKYSLNGLLVGAAVGAGFAAIESAGYAFDIFMSNGMTNMLINIILRAIFAPGGHVVYAAFYGYALSESIGKKGCKVSALLNWRVWVAFLFSIAIHGAWDMPFDFLCLKEVALLGISWTLIYQLLIPNGLRQIKAMQEAEISARKSIA